MMTPSGGQRLLGGKASNDGFSLLELLVAMAVFLVISAASFTLFSKHVGLLSQEQGIAGLNIGLRNAMAQIQLDMVNAGNGRILGPNVPAWPVGVTITNRVPPATTCDPTSFNPPQYQSGCFDTLNLILVDPNTPALNTAPAGGGTISTSAGTSLNAPVPVGWTAAALANQFQVDDKILFVQSCSGSVIHTNSSGCAFTTAILNTATPNTTAPGCSAATPCVTLTFNSTLPGGGNNSADDPLGLTTHANAAELTDQFGPNDWVVRLSPITYNVDVTVPTDPQLTRTQAGSSSEVMDQVIAFKVGATLWNDSNTSSFRYNYDASTYSTGLATNPIPDPYDFTIIRSVRVSLIGRTQPDLTNPYRNNFDSGPYQILGNSIIVDPRNLTMNND